MDLPCLYDENGMCWHLGADFGHTERRQVYVYNNSGDQIDYFSDIEDWYEARDDAMPPLEDAPEPYEWVEDDDPDKDMLSDV